MSNAECETIIRYDDESDAATVYTASERQFRKFTKWGWTLVVKSTHKGQPTGWQGTCPKKAVRLRKRLTLEAKRRKGNPDALRKARAARASQRPDRETAG